MRLTRENPADTFLLRAVSYRFGTEEDAGELCRLARGMDSGGWERLRCNAEYHEMVPLLHAIDEDCSAAGAPLSLPPGLARRWAEDHLWEQARTAVIRSAAEKALRALADGGLRAAPLKGFFLDSMVYARKGIRAYRDLDLLVEEGSLSRLNHILLSSGFKPHPHRPSFVPPPAHTVYLLPLEGGEMVAEVDIHVGMHWPHEYENRTRFSPPDLWAHAFPVEVDGLPAWALRAEQLVVTTILDAAVNHRYARLIRFRDLVEISRRFQVDWEEVVYWSQRWQVASFVAPGLLLLSEMAEDLPGPREAAERSMPSYAALRSFLRSLRASSLPGHRSRSFTLPNLLFFLLADSPARRMRGLIHLPRHALRGLRRF